jgi:Icc-related predicted phosphoesterase
MKLTIATISDTHNKHKQLIHPIPKADVLIHAGDISSKGHRSEVESFLKWFKSQPHPYKIFIAGNHDISFDGKICSGIDPYTLRKVDGNELIGKPEWLVEMLEDFHKDPCNFYLEDSSYQIEGVNFWGSPYSPRFGHGWAFNEDRGYHIREHWDLIPEDTHVVITHGPVKGKVDYVLPNSYQIHGEHVGCSDLEWVLTKKIKPLLHVCGHVHEAYGVNSGQGTFFINTSICTLQYEPINKPFNLEIDIETKTVNLIL